MKEMDELIELFAKAKLALPSSNLDLSTSGSTVACCFYASKKHLGTPSMFLCGFLIMVRSGRSSPVLWGKGKVPSKVIS
jgi:hypothetical protein